MDRKRTLSSASPSERAVEQDLQWQALLADERDKRAVASDLYSIPPTREFRKAVRDLWGAYEAVLDVYIRALTEGRTLYPAPLEILTGLRIIVSYLAVGQMPGLVAGAISEGRRGAAATERRDIGFAVAYMMAASKPGLEHAGEQIIIADERPVKTVCEAFGVKRTTAQSWRKKIEPAFLGVNRIDGQLLDLLMRGAGERYKAAGRSASAIARRGTHN
jgi:hypothetical protein